MSSSEEEDERLKEAIAPNFYIGSQPTSDFYVKSETAPNKLSIKPKSSRTTVSDKPSLRPDKQKELSNLADLDIDGFSKQFKDHVSRKLSAKLEKELDVVKAQGSTEDCCALVEDSVLIFSTSNFGSQPLKQKKKPKRRVEEDLKDIHRKKKKLLNGGQDSDSSSDEDSKLSSIAVSGETILCESAIKTAVKPLDTNPFVDKRKSETVSNASSNSLSSAEGIQPTKRKKKKKKKSATNEHISVGEEAPSDSLSKKEKST